MVRARARAAMSLRGVDVAMRAGRIGCPHLLFDLILISKVTLTRVPWLTRAASKEGYSSDH
ncbi:hypothetical protein GCM10022245_47460 [Streptomyces mayteni]